MKVTINQVLEVIAKPDNALKLTLSEWQVMLTVLRSEKMLAHVGFKLIKKGILTKLDPRVKRHFDNAVSLANQQATCVHRETSVINACLKPVTEDVVYLKGAAYEIMGLNASLGRVYSDIDIWVPKAMLSDCERQLATYGWLGQQVDDYDDAYYRQWAHEIPPMVHAVRGTIIDVHHNLVPPVSGKSIDMSAFMADNVVENNGKKVLKPAAMFFHSAIHLFFNEDFANAMRDMHDLYALYQEKQDDINHNLPALTLQYGFANEIALALVYLKNRFGITVTDNLLRLMPEWRSFPRSERYIFDRVLFPQHPMVINHGSDLAVWLGMVRGHRLKMPVKTLAYHACMKAYRGLVESIVGEHAFIENGRENPVIRAK